MPFVPVANVCQVEAVYLLDGQTAENTLYYRAPSPPSLESVTDLADAVSNAIRTSLLPFMSQVVSLLRVVATMIDVADGIFYVSTTGLPAAGGDVNEPAPNNVAACLSLRTSLAGRSFRGRNYVMAIPNSAITVNTLSTDFTNGVASAYDDILAAGADIGWEPVVVSRYSGFTIVDGRKVPTPRAAGIATPITSHFFVDRTVDSMRRRLPGRGR